MHIYTLKVYIYVYLYTCIYIRYNTVVLMRNSSISQLKLMECDDGIDFTINALIDC